MLYSSFSLQYIRRILQSSNPFHAHLNVSFFCNNSYFSFLYAANRLIYCFPWNQCLRLTRDYILYKRLKEILTKSACSKNSVLKTFLLSSHVLSKNPQTMWAIAPTISPFNLDFPNITSFQRIYFLFALQIHDNNALLIIFFPLYYLMLYVNVKQLLFVK